MGLEKTMIVAGIGCRRGAPAAEIEAAIRAALTRAKLMPAILDAVATSAAKHDEPGINAAAKQLGVSVVLVAEADLLAAAHRTATHSERVRALVGVPSVAEAAALAIAGPTARLISPRIVAGSAACALAESEAAAETAT
jgi:cobalt-precorrin 5A hydrolase